MSGHPAAKGTKRRTRGRGGGLFRPKVAAPHRYKGGRGKQTPKSTDETAKKERYKRPPRTHPEDEIRSLVVDDGSEVNPVYSDPAALMWIAHMRATPKLTDKERAGIVDGDDEAADDEDGLLPLRTKDHFVDCTLPSTQSLQGILKRHSRLANRGSSTGDLRVLILTRSAIRACDLLKEMAFLKLNVCKLFGKHLKVAQQREVLNKKNPIVAIGTPKRVMDVGVDWSSVELIVVDVSRDEAKKFSILTMPGVAQDFFTLFRTQMFPAVVNARPHSLALFE